jgi:hypothetical protein
LATLPVSQSFVASDMFMHNRLAKNFHLSNKKALYYNLKLYYEVIGKNPFDYMPVTFHLVRGVMDPAWEMFK